MNCKKFLALIKNNTHILSQTILTRQTCLYAQKPYLVSILQLNPIDTYMVYIIIYIF